MEHDDPLDREGAAQAPAAPANATDQDAIDWTAVEHDFIHSGLSQERIAERHGTTRQRVARRAKADGWARLVPTKPLPFGPKPRPPGAPKPSRAQRRAARILERLYRALDEKMKLLEERMAQAQSADGVPQSAADAERDTRNLGAFARLYAKLVELDEAARNNKTGQGSDKPAATRSDDADQFRRDLALRLERLNRATDA